MLNGMNNIGLENFKDYNIEDVIARRAINSKNPGSTTIELLISN